MSVKSYADIIPLEPEWEIPNLLPRSFLTLIVGDGGVGKGQLWSDWTGRITRGARLPRVPDQEQPEEPGSVLLITSEDDPNMSPAWRLRAAQANLGKVYDMTEEFSIPESLPSLAEKIDEIGDVRLVVIDPLADNLGYVPGTKRQLSMTSGNVTLRKHVMRPLEKLAKAKGVSLVVIHHTVKSGRVAGSKGITDAARMVLRITRPDETVPLRLITVEKTNIASDTDGPLAYTISGTWPEVVVNYVEPPKDETVIKPKTGPDKILDYLQTVGGAHKVRDIADASGVDYNATRVALTRMKGEHKVINPERGTWELVPQADYVAA